MVRDLKPENLTVNPKRRTLQLSDFAPARVYAEHEGQAAHTDIVTTLWYRAPEILLNDTGQYGCPLDIWSAGLVVAGMVRGKGLIRGDL